jgi:hypothetical protein
VALRLRGGSAGDCARSPRGDAPAGVPQRGVPPQLALRAGRALEGEKVWREARALAAASRSRFWRTYSVGLKRPCRGGADAARDAAPALPCVRAVSRELTSDAATHKATLSTPPASN